MPRYFVEVDGMLTVPFAARSPEASAPCGGSSDGQNSGAVRMPQNAFGHASEQKPLITATRDFR